MSSHSYEIRAQFAAKCSPPDVRKWLDSVEGIAGWWSDDVRGEAGSRGDRFQVRFPSTPVVFELEVTEASDDTVEWHVAENPPWWKGTTIGFGISQGEDEGSTLLFTHRGFTPDDPIIQVITPAWVRFVDNLVAVAESGKANPAVAN